MESIAQALALILREPLTGELALSVTTDGPNLLYLGFLGFLSGGSVLYGWTHRRRAASRD